MEHKNGKLLDSEKINISCESLEINDIEDVRDFPEINTLCSQFNIEQGARLKILKRFHSAMEAGLSDIPEKRQGSSLKMLPTYVTTLPLRLSHSPDSTYFAVDLGGTNVRVLFVRFEGDRLCVTARCEELDQELITGPAYKLFDKIADILSLLANANVLETSTHSSNGSTCSCIDVHTVCANKEVTNLGTVGFTFSFPTLQESLFHGKLLNWTKGFSAQGAINEDVSKMLLDAINKHPDITADNVAILNDTTGTMLCGAVERSHVVAGLILATGCNACYFEKTEEIKKLPQDVRDKCTHMIINTEFGAFGDKGELDDIKTQFDIDLDANTINPGKQTLEKMVSGLYMGEIVRRVLWKMKECNMAFINDDLHAISEPNSFSCSDISSVEDFDYTRILNKYNITENSVNSYALAAICRAVTIRCAKLIAVAMIAMLSKTEGTRKVIAADGSVIAKHPNMKEEIVSVMKNLKPNWQVMIHLTSDGSGKGAGILASML